MSAQLPLCGPPDDRDRLAVLGIITTQESVWRHSIRSSWLRSPEPERKKRHQDAVVTRLVLRGLDASAELASEQARFGDLVFLPSPANLSKDRGPLVSTWQW